MTRAVVTGLGCVTPIGHGVAEFWTSLTSGVSGVRRITLFDASDQECQIAAEVKDWDAAKWMDPKAAGRAGPFTVPAYAPNMASCQVAINLGVRGPTITSVAACAAGIFAFVEAKRMIGLGGG